VVLTINFQVPYPKNIIPQALLTLKENKIRWIIQQKVYRKLHNRAVAAIYLTSEVRVK